MNIENDLNNTDFTQLKDNKVMKLTLLFKALIGLYKAIREIAIITILIKLYIAFF